MESKKEEIKKHKKENITEHASSEHRKAQTKESKKKCYAGKNFNLQFAFGLLVSMIIALLIVFVLVPTLEKKEQPMDSEKITSKIESFINKNLMKGDSSIIVTEKAVEEHGLYKVMIDAGDGRVFASYLTKDKKILLFEGIDIEEVEAKNAENSNEAPVAATTDIPKNDKPKVEVFVMSHCPYGTQIEKGILPVVETLGNKIDFELKFCDYAMHNKKELDEQLRQHCIKTEEPAKFINYLQCFLEADKSDECIEKSNINTSKLNTCVSATDKKYKVTENFNDKSTWKIDRNGNPAFPVFNVYKEDNVKYGVGGSPALVINEVTANSARDSKSLLATICSAFETAPEECTTELSSAQPAPGFGFATTTRGNEASCE